ncbi:MAG: lipoyl(octanoyl) transferase LipB [Dehalococcoidia bacterium]
MTTAMTTPDAVGRLVSVDCLVAGGVPYEPALDWQRGRVAAVRDGGREALALIEHEPVYTMGRRGGRASMRLDAAAMPAPVIDIERGGDVTWHGPGQLVGYPILDLRARGLRAADYVRSLEEVLVAVLDGHGLVAGTVPGRPGVWVDGAKVAAIGVAIRGGVSFHGFALNVAPDLAWYDAIVPCGLTDARVTSMAELIGTAPAMPEVVAAVSEAFEARLAARLEQASPRALLGRVVA